MRCHVAYFHRDACVLRAVVMIVNEAAAPLHLPRNTCTETMLPLPVFSYHITVSK